MYDNKRIASGVGVLLTLWAIVGLLILSAGVGVSVPLSSSGGFNITADYLGASESVTVPARDDGNDPAVLFNIEKSYVSDLRLAKHLNVSDVPGLSGELRILIESDEATISGASFKTRYVSAETATVRGFVLDERNAADVSDQFIAYAGSNPNNVTSTGAALDVRGSDAGAVRPGEGRTALELRSATIETSSLAADQVQLSNLALTVQYDHDSDGTYEYGT